MIDKAREELPKTAVPMAQANEAKAGYWLAAQADAVFPLSCSTLKRRRRSGCEHEAGDRFGRSRHDVQDGRGARGPSKPLTKRAERAVTATRIRHFRWGALAFRNGQPVRVRIETQRAPLPR